jgi:hypothetical protein
MKFYSGDRVVHASSGSGTVQVAGINGLCRVAFDSGTIAVVKTSELAKYLEVKKC